MVENLARGTHWYPDELLKNFTLTVIKEPTLDKYNVWIVALGVIEDRNDYGSLGLSETNLLKKIFVKLEEQSNAKAGNQVKIDGHLFNTPWKNKEYGYFIYKAKSLIVIDK
jgi:hypothetical protein